LMEWKRSMNLRKTDKMNASTAAEKPGLFIDSAQPFLSACLGQCAVPDRSFGGSRHSNVPHSRGQMGPALRQPAVGRLPLAPCRWPQRLQEPAFLC
jgi:hypothetical protein